MKNSKLFFYRNIGLITESEQSEISNTSIAVAGVGGDGGLLSERLTRTGIGKLVIADPDVFDSSNINRQFGANTETFDKKKVDVVGEELKLINPSMDIKKYPEGLTRENLVEFVSQADLVIDEIDYQKPQLSAMLAKEARKQGKYLFMGANIGWGASTFCFDPDGVTFEEYFEFDRKHKTINPKKYLDDGLPNGFSEDLFNDISLRGRPAPGLASSVALVAGLLTTSIICFIIKKEEPVCVPEMISFQPFKKTKNDFISRG